MNQKLIAQLSQEITLLKQAGSNAAFNKHLYAIEMLARFGQTEESGGTMSDTPVQTTNVSKSSGPHAGITTEELKMMGAKVVSSDNKVKTDDGFGNGDSIFDF
ncbi:hypothetical protein ETI06_10965 [Macrococcoides goetzii]|nr:DUF5327 family protein [Macrococcus goetzii]TDM39150.1 hypothetical protein ETI10_11665 [Macrococcus goetzii]TDM42756.1 hypothetical protein ETI08_11130 [Macrococcus goetzii]TDM47050.1 hypothetical protein ETI06_10965 [Macrococcus goetzii]